MSKYLAAVAITLVTGLSAPVMADWMDGDVKYFVGGELGKTWLKVKSADFVEDDRTRALGIKEKDSEFKYKNPIQYGIRFGAYLDENVRVYINLNQLSGSESKNLLHVSSGDGDGDLEFESKITNRQLTVSGDYLFDIGDGLGIPVKPFIGGTLGVNWAEVKKEMKASAAGRIETVPGTDDSKSNTAFAYGIQAGILGQAGDFDIELGYRYLMHKNKFEFEELGEWKMDNSQTAYFAVSYRF
ncbi:outer membrane beta-barrel protein [Endozoicomonas sp. Mp262]|uniref:outer membrane beta-barrel protein n=1 Tax=Endozoicomonas sp. Mp262 TaxID=2919499 RepID=UPI0021D9B04B